jgi:hypothetical protein
MRTLRTFVVVTALAASTAGAASAMRSGPDHTEAVSASLHKLQTIQGSTALRAMGFSSESEILRAEVDPPMPIYQIRLDRLRAYRGGGGAEGLLADTGTALSIVTVDAQARSSVLLQREASAWRVTRLGGANRAVLIGQAREQLAALGIERAGMFLVQIPSLGLEFIGYRQSRELMLAPVIEDQDLGLKAGRAARSEDVLASLVDVARAYREARPDTSR